MASRSQMKRVEPKGPLSASEREVLATALERFRAPAARLDRYRYGLLVGFLGGVILGLSGFLVAHSLSQAPITDASLDKPPVSKAPAESLAAAASEEEEDPPLVPILRHLLPEPRGLLQFRGNAARNWYGEGPFPRHPRILWRYPKEPMCAISYVGHEPVEWCGTGWTGQPVVWERDDGVTEVIVGAFDGQVHFIDAETGRDLRPAFPTGDIIKGSVTLDPDGYPLLYFGSRDNYLRVLALDRDRPVELWRLDAHDFPLMGNDDWDGNPVVQDGVLYEGGENGTFFAIELNRDFDRRGRVVVQPRLLLAVPSWNDEFMALLGHRDFSIESSVALFGERAYFANSAGRVMGLDVSRARQGRAPLVFDFLAFDDIDATVVADGEGRLIVAAELERFHPVAHALGQLMLLDPSRPEDPVVWSLSAPPGPKEPDKGGIWSTPAIYDEMIYATTHAGEVWAVDRETGRVDFVDALGWHAWSSPVVVDGHLLVASCTGELRAYSLENPRAPRRAWSLTIPSGSCIESTPAVWKGQIFVGARDGYLYALGE
ncbi:MAG: PQQ-binding-like beta-propeller repeat protein [Myxococcales bacterium]|nr:PQQ-binding-like beta-propeller repeat protein [Myxococcales bacterium]